MDGLKELLDKAKDYKMTKEEQEAQRRSFVFGNTKIENEQISRESIDNAAGKLQATDEPEHEH